MKFSFILILKLLNVPSFIFGQKETRYTSLKTDTIELHKIKWLDLVCSELPMLERYADSLMHLESLYLKGCDLKELPQGIENIKSLVLLNVQDNQLSDLPEEMQHLENLPNLKVVLLRNNKLDQLPEDVKSLSGVEVLELSGNNFSIEEQERIKTALSGVKVIF